MEFVQVADVKLNDPTWSRQFALVRDVVLPYMWEILNDRIEHAEKSHCIENFKVAAAKSADKYYGVVFLDTDLYKWIEAVSYCLTVERNAELEMLCDYAIDLIKDAQEPDGYLNTYYTSIAPEKRWTNLMEGHELYCAGHLIEAAVAYFKATGKDTLLRISQKFADLIDRNFGKGKRRGYPGHPEIELALIRLYEVSHDKKYLNLAGYFLNERGMGENIFVEECNKENHAYIFPEMAHFKADYFQSQAPVREQCCASGHAVRGMYLYSAMADYARLTDDQDLAAACEKIYENTITRQMYVTGGVGAAKLGERFTSDFDLPADSAYAETCASIGLMLFSSRMWLLNGKKTNYDIWEQALYNTVLSGIGRDGHHFFYVNPLEVVPQTIAHNPTLSHVKTQRQKWFSVACCPPNLARILTSIPGYIYALDGDCLYILSHLGSSFNKGGFYVNLVRKSDEYTLTIEGEPKKIFLRLPENSNMVSDQIKDYKDGYFIIQHTGGKQEYSYSLIPKVRILRAHPSVSAAAGKLCVQRGETVYCAEQVDNATPLSALRLPADAVFSEENVDWLDENMPILKTVGYSESEKNWDQTLYSSQSCVYESRVITLIPYSQWGNRGENEMRVWLTEK
jgi:hypothetical protein